MSLKIKKIFVNRFSSSYGINNKVFGQPLGVKSIVIVSVEEMGGLIRSSELYSGIYIPDILPNIIDSIASKYIGNTYTEESLFDLPSMPFISKTKGKMSHLLKNKAKKLKFG